jgi:MYXO-CTERM domain-containing protein
VIAAADEAGGHGFVTEYASDDTELLTNNFDEVILPQFEIDAREQLNNVGGLRDLLLEAWYTFGSWDGFREALAGSVRVRDGATLDNLLECMDCYFEEAGPEPLPDELPPMVTADAGTNGSADGGADGGTDGSQPTSDAGIPPQFTGDPIWLTDPTQFLDLLDELVIEPVYDTAQLFPGTRVTRLYTTLSADEMTQDPAFDFNLTLDGVSNQHVADRHIYCDGHWVIRLPSGFVLTGNSSGSWPVSLANEIRTNLRVVQDNTDGEPELITDNRARIASQLNAMGVTSTWPPPAPESDSGCGCRVAGQSTDVPWFLFGGVGLAVCVRRRRRVT